PAPGGAARRPPSVLRSPLMVIGLMVLGVLVLVAVFAPLLAAHDPRAITGDALERPSARHRLGTDVPGRDIFAQLVHGARTSLVVAVAGGGLAVAGGIVVGVLPALLGAVADTVSNRLIVFLLALPGLPLLVLVASLAGTTLPAVVAVIAFAGVAPNARVLRGQALSLRQRGFIGAARGFGAGPLYVLRRHLVPGLAPLILVGFVQWAGVAVGLEAGLAFLGLGDPSGISWGLMINRALSEPGIYFSAMWTWWVLPAGLAVTVTVVAFTFVGVALEPAFNPRWLRSS
ncbi:MAG TPA: ABC transporter permease, partial [Acidimicrobiales bacterium]|nr:ABC transporter permease [Acidimicrobiales bacterium]